MRARARVAPRFRSQKTSVLRCCSPDRRSRAPWGLAPPGPGGWRGRAVCRWLRGLSARAGSRWQRTVFGEGQPHPRPQVRRKRGTGAPHLQHLPTAAPPPLSDWTGCGADWLTPVFSGRGEGWTSSAMSGAVGDPTGPEGCEPPPSVSPRGCLLLRSGGRRAAGRAVGVSWSAALQGGPALRARTRRAAGGVKGPAPRRRWPLRLVEQRQAPLPGQAPPPRPRKAARGGCRAHLSGHLPH